MILSEYKKQIFVNFKLFDGIYDGLQEDKIILVDDERIEKVDKSSELKRYQESLVSG